MVIPEDEQKSELIKDLAEMIVGLQVPISVGSQMLGTAGPAWHRVWSGLRLVGWQSPPEVEKALWSVLG